MPPSPAISRRTIAIAAVVVLVALLGVEIIASTDRHEVSWAAAPTTTTPAAVTTGTPTTAPATTAGPVTTMAFPGPVPRSSRRIATNVPIDKIRATSLPARLMGITLAAVVGALALAGFVYGRVRSRVPAAAIPQASPGVDIPQAMPMPPPVSGPPAIVTSLPPPVVEDAVADTVIFEPPANHQPPSVMTPRRDAADDQT